MHLRCKRLIQLKVRSAGQRTWHCREPCGQVRCQMNAGVALQPRVDRFAFQRQYAEHTFMDPPQRFVTDEAFQPFNPEGKFPEGEGSLGSQSSVSQPGEVLFGGVVRAIDDAGIPGHGISLLAVPSPSCHAQ